MYDRFSFPLGPEDGCRRFICTILVGLFSLALFQPLSPAQSIPPRYSNTSTPAQTTASPTMLLPPESSGAPADSLEAKPENRPAPASQTGETDIPRPGVPVDLQPEVGIPAEIPLGAADSGTTRSDTIRPDVLSMVNTVLSASVVKTRQTPINLPIVLKLVEMQNLPIQRDRMTAQIQQTAFLRSLSRMLPNVSATFTATRFNGVIQIFGNQTIPVMQTQTVPQLQGIWNIHPGGQDIFLALAERSRVHEARLRLDSTLQEQLSEAARRYYDFLAARIQLENVYASLTEARSQVTLSEARWQAGIGTRLDLMRSRSQLAERETEQVNAENRIARAEQDLLNTLNLEPDLALTTSVMTAQPRVLVPLSIPTDALVAHAVAKNPSLLAEVQQLSAITSEGRAVLGRIVPTVTLQAYVNGTGPNIQNLGLTRFGGITVRSDLLESLGTAIPLDYRARRQEARRQETQIRQRLRDVQSEVIKAFLDSRAAARSILTSREALASAKEAYRLALGRFQAGLGVNLDVLNAQTALALARARITAAILDFNRSQVSLLQALGETSSDTLLNGLRTLPPLPAVPFRQLRPTSIPVSPAPGASKPSSANQPAHKGP